MRATLPQATIDYCLNCLPPSSPIRYNISSLISFLDQPAVSHPFHFSNQILLESSLSPLSFLTCYHLLSFLTCYHPSSLSLPTCCPPPSSPLSSNLLSSLLTLLSLPTCYHDHPSLLSSLFQLLSSPLSLLSLPSCYHFLFLSSLF